MENGIKNDEATAIGNFIEAIEFAYWLKNSDNGTEHYDYRTEKLTSSIGFSPYDCFIDDIKTIEELYSEFKKK